MLHIGNVKVPTCGGLTRRSFLQAGAAGLVGLNLPDFLAMKAAGAVDDAKADVKIGNTGGASSRCQSAGFLGAAHEPFFLEADPARGDFKVANLSPPPGQTEFRVGARRKLLAELDAAQEKVESAATAAYDAAYQRA